MNLGKLGQALTAREIFDLIQDDLVQVEKKITVESVASVDAVTAIGQYLQSSGGKKGAPEFLSTHPNPGNRVEYLTVEIEKKYFDAAHNGELGEENFQRYMGSRRQ